MFLLVGATTVGVLLATRTGSGSQGCSGTLPLAVDTAPALVAPIRAVAAEYQESTPKADGQCVVIEVRARAAHEAARLLAGGWSEQTAGPAPDVWIPDSTSWLDQARLAEPARGLAPEEAPVFAMSPIVIAMPRPMAAALNWPNKQLTWADVQKNERNPDYWSELGRDDWGPFRLVVPNPQASPAGTHAMMAIVAAAAQKSADQLTAETFRTDLGVQTAILYLERDSHSIPASDDVLLNDLRDADSSGGLLQYLSAAPMSEMAVFDYNRGAEVDGTLTPPEERLVAHYPLDGAPLQEIPFVTLTAASADEARSRAATGFLDALRGEAGQATLTEYGLRSPDGDNPLLTVDAGFSPALRSEPAAVANAAATASALDMFGRIHRRGTTLVVVDTSGSMARGVPDSGGKTRLQLVVEALERSIPLVAEDSSMGLWQFATNLDGDADFRKLISVGPMGDAVDGAPRATKIVDQARALVPEGDTGLYDTALAAFRELTQSYTDGRINQVVLMTDGKNEDPGGGVSLDELVTTLEQEYNPERPVRLITIGYGEDVDMAELGRISAATKAKSYPALDPNSISTVIVEALTSE